VVERVGVKPALTVGLTLFAGGIAWLAQITARGSHLGDVLGSSLIVGGGPAFTFVALTVASSSGVDEANHCTAGGLINMIQQIGGTIGLAVAASHTHGIAATSLTDGFRGALLVSAGIAAVAIVASAVAAVVVLPREARPSRPLTRLEGRCRRQAVDLRRVAALLAAAAQDPRRTRRLNHGDVCPGAERSGRRLGRGGLGERRFGQELGRRGRGTRRP